jgi:hypothetical protein
VANGDSRMFRGSSACATDPNDACCYTCGAAAPPEGCAPDPLCAEGFLTEEEDGVNLRCFDQKRRYGIDFLYPTQRYVNALSQSRLCWSRPDLEPEGCPEATLPNPLFERGRARDLVFLGGIVGVPWQSIAQDSASNDDALVYKTAKQLAPGDWRALLGSPGASGQAPTPPDNPWMIESTVARAGIEPGNAINGSEYDTRQRLQGGVPNDLQYTCISPLPEPRTCEGDSCDCGGGIDSPLCEAEPARSPSGDTQYWAKAYPGTRQLEVLRDFGENSIVASICARNVDDAAQPDFGYRPAIAALVDRLKEKLGDRCLPRQLEPEPDGTVACTLVETRPATPDCACDLARARRAPNDGIRSRVLAQLRSDPDGLCGSADPECRSACLCEVLQVQQVPGQDASSLGRCQDEPSTQSGIEGWCYVADTDDQSLGAPALVERCPATARRALRFVGQGLAQNSVTFISCQGSSLEAVTP